MIRWLQLIGLLGRHKTKAEAQKTETSSHVPRSDVITSTSIPPQDESPPTVVRGRFWKNTAEPRDARINIDADLTSKEANVEGLIALLS